ncbi:uncharacterized protein B0P05DRAFT_561826 [Gilbertella persicaria]|uniref:uncharacterized protein n=1 Tax=Gilbertella persicaria TaxID=101096 RepID=UPI00221E3CC6|nr:uncharacterized protein B0P05DRAFT_561826 [Gilbertella persicaria]KAI8053161.1 hypothetical protein B0P05DRAFT_561826 [Gilbertella persicaria]
MGNTISNSTLSTRTFTNSNEFISIERRKIPRHLQPLKRKHTSKHTGATSNDEHVPDNQQHKKKQENVIIKHQTSSNDNVNTLIPQGKNNELNEINQIFIDHSSSSPQLFRWTKGRRFQNAEVMENMPYPLPNDQIEIDRHRVQFYVIRWAFESRHITPPPIKQKLFEGIRVLNVGCGPGLRIGHPIIDMAEDFCNSTFDALDVCNLLPSSKTSPKNDTRSEYVHVTPPPERESNLRFTLHNILEGPLPFESETFEYVQQSITILAYKIEDWPVVLNELKRVTKPGGYIQLIETELYPHQLGPKGESWRDQILDAIKSKRGNDGRITLQFERLLNNLDLEDVTVKFVSIPIGSWGLDIGNLWGQNFYAFLESAGTFLVDLMQMTNAEYKKGTQGLREELESGEYKAFSNVYVAYGRKKKNH